MPGGPGDPELTALLMSWRDGDDQALERLTPIVYQHLRALARFYMRQERGDHTLQATALVHELFLRLADQREVNWRNRDHFYGTASQVMRRVLVDHARKKQAAKRGGAGQIKVELPLTSLSPDSEVLAIDQALRRLESIDARKAQVVERKYFGGMTTEETADSLSVSAATVERDWTMAKAWLFRELKGSATQT
jgi:RNA polymerase sigma factor (TIGR02999 family)